MLGGVSSAGSVGLRRRHIGSGRVFRSLRRCLNRELAGVSGRRWGEAIYSVIRRFVRRRPGIRMGSHPLPEAQPRSIATLARLEREIQVRLGHANVNHDDGYGALGT